MCQVRWQQVLVSHVTQNPAWMWPNVGWYVVFRRQTAIIRIEHTTLCSPGLISDHLQLPGWEKEPLKLSDPLTKLPASTEESPCELSASGRERGGEGRGAGGVGGDQAPHVESEAVYTCCELEAGWLCIKNQAHDSPASSRRFLPRVHRAEDEEMARHL